MIGFTRGWTVAMGAVALLAAGCQRQGDTSRGQARSTADQSRPQARSAAGVPSASEKLATGQVASAKQDELVLRQGSGAPDLKLKVSPSTQITMGGRQATLSELKEGTQVQAAYEQQGGDQQAIRIDAVTGPAGSGPSSVGAPPANSTPPAATPGSTGGTGAAGGTGATGTERR